MDTMVDHPDNNLIDLEGQVVRVVYSDTNSGFTIAKLQVSDQDEPVTIVGNLMAPPPGLSISLKGQWVHHPKFGRQFRMMQFETKRPTNIKGITAYLGSGQIKGIGPEMAQRIVSRFGLETLDIIAQLPERLAEVPGIGPKRIIQIKEAWQDQRHIRDVMLFLQSYGVSAAYASKIFTRYGQGSIAVVQQNPYRLAGDIPGIGFKIADNIATKLGIENDSPLRLQAGIIFLLARMADDGHTFFPFDSLIEKGQDMLKSNSSDIAKAIAELATQNRIIIEDLKATKPDASVIQQAVYLNRLHRSETFVAQHLAALLTAPGYPKTLKVPEAVQWVQRQFNTTLGNDQKEAIGAALSQKVLIITGGPGTGKTTIIRAIVRLYEYLQARVLLAAPTGRAAKRLSEATRRSAKTIHRLLAYHPRQGEFAMNEHNPLQTDLLVVDECSMIDVMLMEALLKALRLNTCLILVGDVNQLPSVGPGQIFKDMLESNIVPRITFKRIFRQARHSKIVLTAHRINSGKLPDLESKDTATLSDFYFIEQQQPEKILETILTVVGQRIPNRFKLDPISDIQVLTPMHRGILGSKNLNQALQQVLNRQDAHVTRGELRFGLHDKVMQMRNNYDKEVFNGDLGRVTHIDPHHRKVRIDFDARSIEYNFDELEEVVLAYAVTVHKSQGSEYPAVVIPLTTAHYLMLQRNLIYTALTRAKQLVVMVGTKRALGMAVKNAKPRQRHTLLAQRLNRLCLNPEMD